MNRRFLLFMLLALFTGVACKPAFATIYRLEIRQVSPDGPIYSVLCDDNMGVCSVQVPFSLDTQQLDDEVLPLEAGVVMTKYDAYLRFKWKDMYLFTQRAGDSYLRISDYAAGRTEKVMLYASDKQDLLAELEIRLLRDTARKLPAPQPAPVPLPEKQPI